MLFQRFYADPKVIDAHLNGIRWTEQPSDPLDNRTESHLADPEKVRHFLALISRSLDETPIEISAQEHRLLMAKMVGKMSRINFYELLGLPPTAEEQEILAAFFETARLVHPRHCSKTQFKGREIVLRFIFEKVVEAYLTLVDPQHRASYNLIAGIQTRAHLHSSKQLQEQSARALRYYRQAQHFRSLMDEAAAADFLRAAIRLDPQPEYLACLADILSARRSKIPEALDLYRRAISLRPQDTALDLRLAELLEDQGDPEQAKAVYRKVLRASSSHPEAALALRRLEKSAESSKKNRLAMPNFGTLFQSAPG